MLRPTILNLSRSGRWSSAVVLLAVCSLTISVASRFSGYSTASDSIHKTIQKQASPRAHRQRLLKNAAIWIPPAVASDIVRAPRAYPRIFPAGPPVPALLFEEILYNRPPPIFISLA
jgi:hypothetical protein